MKRLIVLVALVALSAYATETWIDPGVGQSSIYNQTTAAGFENGTVVVASGSNAFENVTLDIANIQVGTNDTANAASLTLAGGAVNVTGLMRVGTRYENKSASEGILRVSGGQHVFANGNIADLPYSKAKLVIDGDDDTQITISATDGDADNVLLPLYGSLSAEIRRGTLYSPKSIHMARRCSTTGSIGDGRFFIYQGGVLSSDKNVFIGSSGTGNAGHAEVDMYGGELRAAHLAISYGNNAGWGGVCVLRQYGGLVDITGNTGTYGGVHLPETGPRTAEYHLLGGTVRARQIYHNTTGEGIFKANGGTFQPNSATSADDGAAIRGLTTAALGEKGLTIDTRTYATRINQSFSDMDGAEGNGLLVKIGSSALTIGNGSTTHSKTIVAEGSIIFAASSTDWTSVTVTNGATLSTVGLCATLSLTALTMGDTTKMAVLAIDGTDAISVASPVTIRGGLRVALNGVTSEGSYPIMSCSGEVGAATAFNWRSADVTGVPSGKHAELTTAYDEGENKTTFSVAIVAGTVPAADAITVSSGSQEISGDLDLGSAKRVIEVAKDASLTVSGSAAASGFVKQGDGALLFTADLNRFNLGFELASGLLGFSSMAGTGRGAADAFSQQGGTLQLSDSVADAVFPYTYKFYTPERKQAVVVKTDSDIYFPSIVADSQLRGTLVKRGVGRLTIETAVANQKLGNYGGDATGNFTSKTRFDGNGLAPTNGYRHLQVAEGELRLKARGVGSFLAGGGQNYGIGMNTPDGTVAPALTVDGCLLDMPSGNDRFIVVGEYADADAFWSDAYLNVTNGGTLNVDSLYGPEDRVQKAVTAHVNVSQESVLHTTYACYMGYHVVAQAREKNLLKRAEYKVTGGSRISSLIGFYVGGPTYMTLDGGSVLSGGANMEPANIALQWDCNPCGEFRFQGHSTLCMTTNFTYYSGLSGTTFGFVFDDGVWDTGTAGEQLLAFSNVRYWTMTVASGGLEMPVAAGRTVTLARDITGTGALVKSGDGTLVIRTKLYNGVNVGDDKETLCCVGGARVKEGTLKVQADAVADNLPMVVEADGILDLDGSTQNFSSVSGEGMVRNGSCATLTLAAGSSLTLDNVDASRVYIDFGKTTEDPLVEPFPQNVKIATLTGTTSRDVSNWRIKNTGVSNLKGKFSLVGNDVMMSVQHSGMMIVVL